MGEVGKIVKAHSVIIFYTFANSSKNNYPIVIL